MMNNQRPTRAKRVPAMEITASRALISRHAGGLKRGRPTGSKTSDPVLAAAFGNAVRTVRLKHGLAQEELANQAGIERAHVGRIERGQHVPTLGVVLKLAQAMGVSGAALLAVAETLL